MAAVLSGHTRDVMPLNRVKGQVGVTAHKPQEHHEVQPSADQKDAVGNYKFNLIPRALY